MINRILFFGLLVFISLAAKSQKNIEFTNDHFSTNKAGLKEALKNIEEGDYYFSLGGVNLEMAISYYLKANQFNPNNALLNFKLGRCYLEGNPASEAIRFLLKAYSINPKIDPEIILLIAQAYHLNYQFDLAIVKYKQFKDQLEPYRLTEYAPRINRFIYECENGTKMMQSAVRVFVENLGSAINTEYPDYGAVVNIDESILFYTSRRPTTTGGERNPLDMMFFEDTYWSINKNNKWLSNKNIGKQVNTNGHDAVVGLAPDGQTMILYRDENNGDLFWTSSKGEQWSNPVAFPAPINSKYQESSASFSYNGKRLFFVSDRPGGYGGKDIYYCDMDQSGKWGQIFNLGNVVNTADDEIGVFVQADGKTIYFSSEGHQGMGSFDVFKTVFENGRSTKPENLGYPINSPGQDVFFSIGASGRNAYFSSDRSEGLGDQDIYKIIFLGPEKEPMYNAEDPLIASNSIGLYSTNIEQVKRIETTQLTLLKGVVVDEITQEPLEATIELIDNEEGIVLATFSSNSVSGKYVISLPSGHNYGVAVTAEGYLFYSENFIIPKTEYYKEEIRNIQLQRVEVGKGISLRNIFFDYNKAILNKESIIELKRLLALLNKYPSIKVEVGGHTDNVGNDAYNLDLSLQRANAVIQYLVQYGVSKNRLSAKGYGFTKPVATNDSEEGRQLNRRSEIIILAK